MDRQIQEILLNETRRQKETIELIASENFTSDAVMRLCGSVFTNKYAEGMPNARYYNGCDFIDDIENLAIEYVTKLFKCEYANVQPHSGANANLAVFFAFLSPGDIVLGMDLSSGGHLSHGSKVNLSGKWFRSISYGLDAKTGLIDYDSVERLANEYQPKILIGGGSAYSREIDWKRLSEIAKSVNAIFLADVSHYSGLIVADQYSHPFPYADIITTTTHKILRGPRGGLILWNNNDYTKKIHNAVFPGTQGGPLMHIIAAKAQCFYEALQSSFREYAYNVKQNANQMAMTFQNELDVKVVSGGTDCHMFMLDLRDERYSGREYADLLEFHGITVNKNSIPNDPRNFIETSGIRIGVAAETTRGRDSQFFHELAYSMTEILRK